MGVSNLFVLSSPQVRRRLALCPFTAPVFAAFTTLSSPFFAAACLPARLFSIFLSNGQYAYGSTLLAPFVSPLAPFLALNLQGPQTSWLSFLLCEQRYKVAAMILGHESDSC